MSRITPSSLQNFNNELIKGLEIIKHKHREIIVQLSVAENEERELQTQMNEIQAKISILNQRISIKRKKKIEYEKLIEETESAYCRIVDSSQLLLDVVTTQFKEISNSNSE